MMICPKTGYETFGAWRKKRHPSTTATSRIRREWVSGEGLASPQEAKLVRAGQDGAPITDGVFPEAKEDLAGYWIVDV